MTHIFGKMQTDIYVFYIFDFSAIDISKIQFSSARRFVGGAFIVQFIIMLYVWLWENIFDVFQ